MLASLSANKHVVTNPAELVGSDCLNPVEGVGEVFFFFNVTATTEIYTLSYTLSLHDALPIYSRKGDADCPRAGLSKRGALLRWIRSEEHTSELQSHSEISYAVFCLKKKKKKTKKKTSRAKHQKYKYTTQS